MELDGQSFPLRAGSLFQVAPGKPLAIATAQEQTLQFYSFHFRYVLVDWAGSSGTLTADPDWLPLPLAQHSANPGPLLEQFRAAYDSWQRKMPGYEWEAQRRLIRALELALQAGAERSADDQRFAAVIEKAVETMKTRLTAGFHRDELAAELGLSPTYFSTLFKQRTGYSPLQYFNKLRIDRAKLLLRATRLPIADVAREAGYDDSFYFARAFLKSTGMTPSEYRRG